MFEVQRNFREYYKESLVGPWFLLNTMMGGCEYTIEKAYGIAKLVGVIITLIWYTFSIA